MTAPYQIIEKTVQIRPEQVRGGHVNNSFYFIYANEAFTDWYAALGFDNPAEPVSGPMMAHLELDFMHELTYPGAVLCRLTVMRVGRSSLEHTIELFAGDANGPLAARGKAVNVWFDRDLARTAAWPADILRLVWYEAAPVARQG